MPDQKLIPIKQVQRFIEKTAKTPVQEELREDMP
jgi:hypothetical protein